MVPPVVEPPLELGSDSTLVETPGAGQQDLVTGLEPAVETPVAEATPEAGAETDPALPEVVPEEAIMVSGPLFDYQFTNRGARMTSAQLSLFRSLRTSGPVELIPDDTDGSFGLRVVLPTQTLELRDRMFTVDPPGGLTLTEGGGAEDLTFRYEHPTAAFSLEVTYTFHPDSYLIDVNGVVTGVDSPHVASDLATGVAFNEADSVQEATMMAFVSNHLEEGIESHRPSSVEEEGLENGPFLWAAYKSKFFVIAMLPDRDQEKYLGGMLTAPDPVDVRALVAVTHTVDNSGAFNYQIFVGPLEYATLSALGDDLQEVNPYGWKFFRPIVRPFVAVIMWILNFLHENLSIGYGWVLILFGVMMRVLLWPLNQKAMRAQMRNMAVQPLLQEIQKKYKDQPEKLQKEMMKLYKEHGFNPLAGCLPMLVPWPVLIALFFVFQNTIELRGVSFLWLPDLSAKDPFFILPVFLAVSMFFLQFISFKSMNQDNPQMKMMMYGMPLFFGFIFMNFASGLNLYYATANIATIPQQLIIAKERKKVMANAPKKKTGG
jgi:YidC/Oxa1 family membrane protein insertase